MYKCNKNIIEIIKHSSGFMGANGAVLPQNKGFCGGG